MLSLDPYTDKSRRVGVYGLGFAGLHLALEFARVYRVVAADFVPQRAVDLGLGVDVFQAVPNDRLAASGIRFAADARELAECGVVIIVAPPAPDGAVNLAAMKAAAAEVGKSLRPGGVVVFETAASMKVVETECVPVLASASGLTWGEDFRTGVSCGGVRPEERRYKVVDPVKRIAGDAPAVGLFLRSLYAPFEDVSQVPASALLGVSARDDRPDIPAREIAVGVSAGLALVACPWWVGGQALGAQIFATAAASAAFCACFWPDQGADPAARALAVWSRLKGFVPFWIGLALLSLFVCQGLNPHAVVEFDGTLWQVVAVSHCAWLPAGVEAPFTLDRMPGGMNAFRTALIFAGPWLLLCALWCGVRSRRVIARLILTVLASGTLMAIYAIGGRVSGELQGSRAASVASPFGPFLYQNQAGAYFYLLLFLAATFGLKAWLETAQRGRSGGPHWVALGAAIFAFAAVIGSRSFGAFLVTAAFLAVTPYAVKSVYNRARRGVDTPAAPVVWMSFSLLMVALVAAVAWKTDFSGMLDKVQAKLEMARSATLDDRGALRRATWELYGHADSKWFGEGAGSYRWSIVSHLARSPELSDPAGRFVSHANYAHNDWLQILAEWGALGCGLVLGLCVWLGRRMTSIFREPRPEHLPLVAGLVFLGLHAGMDYLLFNQAIALLLSLLLFVSIPSESRKPVSA